MVIIVHSLLAFLISVPNLRQTPLENCLGLLHLALPLGLLSRDAHSFLLLHVVELFVQGR